MEHTITIKRGDILLAVKALAASLGVYAYQHISLHKYAAPVLFFAVLAGYILLFSRLKTAVSSLTDKWFAVSFSFLFSGFAVFGKYVDLGLALNLIKFVIIVCALTVAVYPFVMILLRWLSGGFGLSCEEHSSRAVYAKRAFIVVVVAWLLGYLAMFPGVYAVDAMTWYNEFKDPLFPVTDQWSPVYAGLFYLFVEFGRTTLGSYEAGFAIFTALQMGFLLWVVRRSLLFICERSGKWAVICTAAFFAVIPTHVVMACQSEQNAPFMGCFAMLIMLLIRMIEDPEAFWKRKRNRVLFILWGVMCCIFRNNAYVMLLLFLPFSILYHKHYRRFLAVSLLGILLAATIYKGPVLQAFGVVKNQSVREMMTLPLQQMASVYVNNPKSLTKEQTEELLKYVDSDTLLSYSSYPSISDAVKAVFQVELFEKDPVRFFKLYGLIGLKNPGIYFAAAYTQDLGILYVDKEYPDPRMFHPYLNYASYDLQRDNYITIRRLSLFPAYNQVLGLLFGYDESGYGGEADTYFSDVPFLGPLCRISVYFWLLLLMTLYVILKRLPQACMLLLLCMAFTLTILLSPVIVYRYYCAIVFCMPLLIQFIRRQLAGFRFQQETEAA